MGFMHTESVPMFHHSYEYKNTTVRDAVGFIKHPPEKLFVQRTDSAAERMDIDAVVRKAPGMWKGGNRVNVKAEQGRLYKDACGGVGDVEKVLRRRTADQMQEAPVWSKTAFRDTNLQIPPAMHSYSDLKEADRYATLYPRPLMQNPRRAEFPKYAAGETKITSLELSDPRKVPRRRMWKDPNFTVPDADAVFDMKATTWGPEKGKAWIERVGHGNGYWNDPQTIAVDQKKNAKRREESKAAYRLIRERGRQSALNALWSNVDD
jgi:hypothetical protein